MTDAIQLPSGVLAIMDPCYLDMYASNPIVRKFSVIIDTNQTGKVDLVTVISDEGIFGERVVGTKLTFNTERSSKKRKKIGDCGVDSGQLLFFDKAKFNVLLRKSVCSVYPDDDVNDELSKYYHVTETGMGDGVYPVFAEYDEYGNINSIEVIFLAEKCEKCGTSLMEGNKLCFKCDLLDRSE